VDVVYFVGSLRPTSLARQVLALAPTLRPTVVVLDKPSAWSEPLRRADVAVEEIGLCGVFDAPAFLALRRMLQERRGAVVHAWGRAAMLAARTAGVPAGRLVVSGLFRSGDKVGWMDRWLLSGTRAVAFTGRDADAYRSAGWKGARVARVRPGLPDPGEATQTPLPGVPDDVEVLLGLGPLDLRKGFRDAIYAQEMLRYLDERRRLILVGEGDGREALEALVEAFGAGGSILFPGWQADLGPWLGRADLVLAPALGAGGVYAVLDAMFAGRAVIAARTADLAEVIAPGETGVLVPASERMQLARECRFLLQDAPRREALGRAAREAAQRTWALEPLAATLREVYAQVG